MKRDNMLGKISDIETMGLVDGPGMRLVLFLSGCNLRCKFCHNPETWNMTNFKQQISPQEVLQMYKKNEAYYGERGGVTFSGGEPLLQAEFVRETAKLLKQNHIHVALDTAGAAVGFEKVLDFVDLIILDVKAVLEEEYEFITGSKIDNFEKFLEFCQKKHKKLWLRQVILPGINDDEAHIQLLADFANKLSDVEKVELLPYHTLGRSKYDELKIPYPLDGVPEMDKERCKQLQSLLNSKLKLKNE